MDSSISGVDSTTRLGTLHAFIMVLFGFPLDTFRLAAVALDTCAWWVHGCVWWGSDQQSSWCMSGTYTSICCNAQIRTSELIVAAIEQHQLLALCE
jgi:hypothetical protein